MRGASVRAEQGVAEAEGEGEGEVGGEVAGEGRKVVGEVYIGESGEYHEPRTDIRDHVGGVLFLGELLPSEQEGIWATVYFHEEVAGGGTEGWV